MGPSVVIHLSDLERKTVQKLGAQHLAPRS